LHYNPVHKLTDRNPPPSVLPHRVLSVRFSPLGWRVPEGATRIPDRRPAVARGRASSTRIFDRTRRLFRQRRAARHPAARASASEQNQRSPLFVEILVLP